MRLINADSLVGLAMDSTILGDGFKQVFVALVNGEPTIEERKTGTPCDLCRHNPPSSGDGKPCSYCPAE